MANENVSPPARKPLTVIGLITLYPFVMAGLVWFVVALFPDAPDGAALLIVIVAGNAVMNALLIYYRRKTRDRWIRAEAAKWLRNRSRHKRLHRAAHLLLWLPSVFALWVLIFLPLATHLIIHPSSRYLPDYRIPIPWTWTALSVCLGEECWAEAVISSKGRGQFGVTPFWPTAQLSMASFGTPYPEDFNLSHWRPRGASQMTEMELKVGASPLVCWQYLAQRDLYNRGLIGLGSDVPLWEVVCVNRTFDAKFLGRAEDLPAFFSVLRRTARVK